MAERIVSSVREYIPTTREVRRMWVIGSYEFDSSTPSARVTGPEFDRWLDEVKREAAAHALIEFADAHRMPWKMFEALDGSPVKVNDLLRERAAQIREGRER